MNEKIKQLADQARVLADEFQEQWKAGPSNEEFFQEKFAELIVAECMRLNSKELSITAIERLLPLYAEHFGVEL